ncbi:MAG: agmatinase [bacterium]|nr:agmatinase [bacterium]
MRNFSYPTLEPYNFGGLEKQNYKSSKIVIVPVPYESTTYYQSGAKEGPWAIINASRHMEGFDIEQKNDISKIGIFTLEELEPSKNSPRETILRVENVISNILEDEKIPIMLGGEHSITLGAVSAFKKKYSREFSVLQFDAHSDLRDEFEGTKFHHGCVMRRVVDDLRLPITQVGVRSMSMAEEDFLKESKKSNIFFGKQFSIEEIMGTLKENVYITLDLDVFDPSIMPSVGTPEPGGLTWEDVLGVIREVGKNKNIIGVDVVELSPIPGLIAPDFLAAKLIYKIIGFISNSISLNQQKESVLKKEMKKNFEIFSESQLELEIWSDDKIVFRSDKQGLAGLMEFIEKYNHKFKHSIIFDKKAGRGVALLAAYLNVKMVYAKIGSDSAIETLKEANIDFDFKENVPNILNKKGTDICPIEKLSISHNADEFYKLLKESRQIIS